MQWRALLFLGTAIRYAAGPAKENTEASAQSGDIRLVNQQTDESKQALRTSVAELFASEANLAIVQHPDKIDVCLLSYLKPPNGKLTDERYAETEFVDVPTESAAAMQTALLSDSTYRWGAAKGCWPRYQTRLRFHQGEKVVAIDFCFGCKILRIFRDGGLIGGENFDARAEFFASEIRRIFPKDESLAKAAR